MGTFFDLYDMYFGGLDASRTYDGLDGVSPFDKCAFLPLRVMQGHADREIVRVDTSWNNNDRMT